MAHCDRVLAKLAITAGDLADAKRRVTAAAAIFREGDYLVELAETLVILAHCTRASGDLDSATRQVEEALSITSPRGFLISHAGALAVRARNCADRVTAGYPDELEKGRDAAQAAYRIATRRRLAWQQLDALDAHTHLDEVEGIDRGWAQQAATLRARLIPTGLDPEPLGTVEHGGGPAGTTTPARPTPG